MKVRIYVEGGGDKSGDIACREGFRKLFTRAGFEGQMPSIRASGPRHIAYNDFKTAMRQDPATEYPLLLVDSEGPVADGGWIHLRQRDGWEKPPSAGDDQAQMMVRCMEIWCVADRDALRNFFHGCLQERALPALNNLESRSKADVQGALEHATRDCGRDRAYKKGRRSFELLGKLNPDELNKLPHFARLCDTLRRELTS